LTQLIINSLKNIETIAKYSSKMENKKYHNVGTVPKIIVGGDNIDASKTHSRRITVLARII
jgi:hypothetical protein